MTTDQQREMAPQSEQAHERNAAPSGVASFPLTPTQLDLYYRQLLLGGRIYVVPFAVLLDSFDRESFQAALLFVTRENDVLRTQLVETPDGPRQVVLGELQPKLIVEDVPFEVTETALRERGCDLAPSPKSLSCPLEHKIVRGSNETVAWLASPPHIFLDYSSMERFVRRTLEIYERLRAGVEVEPEEGTSFAEYAGRASALLDSPESIAFWRERLQNVQIGADQARLKGSVLRWEATGSELERLRQVADQRSASVGALFRAAYALWLDILHDDPAGVFFHELQSVRPRRHREMLGCFYRVLPVFVDGEYLGSDVSPDELLRETRMSSMKHARHAISMRSQVSLTPNLQKRYFFNYIAHERAYASPLMLVWDEHGVGEIHLRVMEWTDRVEVVLEVSDAPLADANPLDRIRSLVDDLGSEPESISELRTTRSEEDNRLRKWNSRKLPQGELDRTLLSRFDSVRERQGAQTAIVSGDEELSFEDVDAIAWRLATKLNSCADLANRLVAINVRRCAMYPALALGAWRAGFTILPLDTDWPLGRLSEVIDDARPGVLVTDSVPPRFPSRRRGDHSFRLQITTESLRAGPFDRMVNSEALPSADAYVVFTSGSTGRPKGAINTHAGLLNRLLWMQEILQLTEDDTVIHKTPVGFDVSMWELVYTLMTGSRLAVVAPKAHLNFRSLLRTMERKRVTVAHFVPSMLEMFLDVVGEDAKRASALRAVICSGESLSERLVERFHALGLGADLYNFYGPAEAAIDVTEWKCAHDHSGVVPIGRPVANTAIHIRDRHGRPRPPGMVGEIWLGGIQVGRGYLNRPDLTEERFVEEPTGRFYRTGDLGRFRLDGAVEYCGRTDAQVKIHGVRVELEELEHRLRACDGVKNCAVLAHKAEGETKIVAYYVSSSLELRISDLREHLASFFPSVVLPSTYLRVDALPVSANGKIDRKRLPEIVRQASVYPDQERSASSLESRVAMLMAETLGLRHARYSDDFFALGGHSVAAVRFWERLRKEFRTELPLSSVLETPTVEGIAHRIATADPQSVPPDCVQLSVPPPESPPELDAELSPSITPPRGQSASRVKDTDSILLTGATGFVGAFLLRDLVLQRPNARVVCVARGADAVEARERVLENLRRYGLWSQVHDKLDRVDVALGDLAEAKLGLGSQYDRFVREIGVVVHNGAQVNMVLPYRELRPANVTGTANLLRFSVVARPKEFHYVSSLAVMDLDGETVRESDPPAPLGTLNGYARTKAVAETLVRKLSSRGLAASIYRAGRVGGSRADGACNSNDFLWQLTRVSILLGAAPDVDTDVDLIPADDVSRFVASRVSRAPAPCETFHLFGTLRVPWASYVEAVKGLGYQLEMRPLAQWLRLLQESRLDAVQEARHLLSLSDGSRLLCPSGLEVDCSRTLSAAQEMGRIAPDYGLSDARASLLYLQQSGFFPEPSNVRVRCGA